MKKILRIMGLSILTLPLVGCGTKEAIQEDIFIPSYKVPASEENLIRTALLNSADSIDKSMKIYSASKSALSGQSSTYDSIRQANAKAKAVPVGMERLISIKWDGGPIQPVLKQIERVTQYEVRYLNTAPAYDVNATLRIEQKPVIDVLRAIEAQNTDTIKIDIMEEAKIIEVTYVQ